jgi:hypothetical protein
MFATHHSLLLFLDGGRDWMTHSCGPASFCASLHQKRCVTLRALLRVPLENEALCLRQWKQQKQLVSLFRSKLLELEAATEI